MKLLIHLQALQKEVISYAETLETMADAQVEMMELMEINRCIAARAPSLEIMSVPVMTSIITLFTRQTRLTSCCARLPN